MVNAMLAHDSRQIWGRVTPEALPCSRELVLVGGAGAQEREVSMGVSTSGTCTVICTYDNIAQQILKGTHDRGPCVI